ncbi:31598_t:CDS:2, partial [Racocetra persica]
MAKLSFNLLPLLLITLATVISAKEHQIMVGQGGIVFVPSNISVNVGDVVIFTWASSPHSVIQEDDFNSCIQSNTIPNP